MITKIEEEFITSLANEGKREDGRKLDEYRDLKIETEYIDNAEGSALVTMGETEVLVGIKVGVATPYPDSPNDGILMVNAELGPKASPKFESGPPKEDAVEMSRVIDRGIRESKAIQTEKLCITPGEKVWIVSVDIDIINDGGNIMDVGGIAAAAALLTAKLPKLDEEGKPINGEYSGKLPVTEIPIPVSAYKIGETIVHDVNYEEEEAASVRYTVTSTEKFLCAMQKSGPGRLKTEEVYNAAEFAFNKAKELRKIVKSAAK